MSLLTILRRKHFGGLASAATGGRFEVFDAFVEFTGQGFNTGGWNIAKRAAEELLPKGTVSSLYVSKLLVGVGGDFLLETLVSFGTSGIQFRLGGPAPGDQSRFGHAKLAGDTGETQAGNAQAEEFVAGGNGMHGECYMADMGSVIRDA